MNTVGNTQQYLARHHKCPSSASNVTMVSLGSPISASHPAECHIPGSSQYGHHSVLAYVAVLMPLTPLS